METMLDTLTKNSRTVRGSAMRDGIITNMLSGGTIHNRQSALRGWIAGGRDAAKPYRAAARAANIVIESDELAVELFTPAELRTIEQRALDSTTFWPEHGFLANLQIALRTNSAIRQVATRVTSDKGASVAWPTIDDDNTGEYLPENRQSAEADAAFTALVFQARCYGSKVQKVPHELLEDTALPMFESALGIVLGTRIARKTNTDFTTNIVAGTPVGKTAASATAIAPDEVLDLLESLPDVYAENTALMMRRSTYFHLRRLKDGNGHHLFGQRRLGERAHVDGCRVVFNSDMEAIGSGAKVILAGDMSTIAVCDIGPLRLRRMDEKYVENDQVGFLAVQATDCSVQRAGTPIKCLQMGT